MTWKISKATLPSHNAGLLVAGNLGTASDALTSTNLQQIIRRNCAIHFKGLGGTQAVPMPKVVMLEIQAELPGTSERGPGIL